MACTVPVDSRRTLRRFLRPGGPLARSALNGDPRLAEVSKWIREQPDKRLARAAERVGLSSGYLREYFRLRVGESYSRFVRRYKVWSCCQHLFRERSVRLVDAANEAGFGTLRSMSERLPPLSRFLRERSALFYSWLEDAARNRSHRSDT